MLLSIRHFAMGKYIAIMLLALRLKKENGEIVNKATLTALNPYSSYISSKIPSMILINLHFKNQIISFL